mmetsp:Transcript_88156/g.161447  ORF Transcript_88156/g.161447 Transcript_88156/m.161447 type:complete len:222 (+) Transcript_88156:3-668(+)
MLQAAARSLSHAVEVVGAIMVPSSDQYVKDKAQWRGDRTRQPSYELRAELIQAMAVELDLGFQIHISDAEAERGLFYLEVVEHLAKVADCIARGPVSATPILIFVTGGDRWNPLLQSFEGGDGVVVIPRAGDETNSRIPARSEWPRWARDNPCRVVAEPLAGRVSTLSSTRLRSAIDATLKENSNEAPHVRQDAAISAAADFMTPSAASIYVQWLFRGAGE